MPGSRLKLVLTLGLLAVVAAAIALAVVLRHGFSARDWLVLIERLSSKGSL
jgi:hypothetical protein